MNSQIIGSTEQDTELVGRGVLALDESWAVPFVITYCVLVGISANTLNEFDARVFPQLTPSKTVFWIQMALLPIFYGFQCVVIALLVRFALRLITKTDLLLRNVLVSLGFAHLPLTFWAAASAIFLGVTVPRLALGTPSAHLQIEYGQLIAITQLVKLPFFALASGYFVYDLWLREQRRLSLISIASVCGVAWLLMLVVDRLW